MRSDACIHICLTHELLANRNTQQPFVVCTIPNIGAVRFIYKVRGCANLHLRAHRWRCAQARTHGWSRQMETWWMLRVCYDLHNRDAPVVTAGHKHGHCCLHRCLSNSSSVSAPVKVKTCSRGRQGRTGLAGQLERPSADCPTESPWNTNHKSEDLDTDFYLFNSNTDVYNSIHIIVTIVTLL